MGFNPITYALCKGGSGGSGGGSGSTGFKQIGAVTLDESVGYADVNLGNGTFNTFLVEVIYPKTINDTLGNFHPRVNGTAIDMQVSGAPKANGKTWFCLDVIGDSLSRWTYSGIFQTGAWDSNPTVACRSPLVKITTPVTKIGINCYGAKIPAGTIIRVYGG